MELPEIKESIADMKDNIEFVPKEFKNAILDKIKELEALEKELESKTKEVSDADKLLAELNEKQAAKKKTVKAAKTPAAKKKVEVEVKKVEAEKAKAVAHKAKVVKEVKDIEKDVAALIKKGGDAVAEFNKGRSAKEIMNDAERDALPAGKRISAQGNVYYENRPDHADADPNVKLEKGGKLTYFLRVAFQGWNEKEQFNKAVYFYRNESKRPIYDIERLRKSIYFEFDSEDEAEKSFKEIKKELENNGINGFYYEILNSQVVGKPDKFEKGGLISGTLYSTYTNPIEYLSAIGAKTYSNLNYSTKKNGINYYIGTKNYKAIVVAFIEDENNYMIDKEDAIEMAETARTKDVDSVELYTNYGIELSSKHETPKTIGFDKIYKITNGFAKGGSIMNQYEGKTAEQVWSEWTVGQRLHFLNDHSSEIKSEVPIYKKPLTTYSRSEYKDIPKDVQEYVQFHISEGQYEHGGEIYKSGRVKELKVGQVFELPNGEIIEIKRLFIENIDEDWVEFTRDGKVSESKVKAIIQFLNNLKGKLIDHKEFERGGELEQIKYLKRRIEEVNAEIKTLGEINSKDAHEKANELRWMVTEMKIHLSQLGEEVKFEHGGNIAEGNRQMAINKSIEILHHAEELVQKTKNAEEIPAWVIALIERASTDLYDVTHYLDGVEEMEDEHEEEHHDDTVNEHEEGDYGIDGFAKGGALKTAMNTIFIFNKDGEFFKQIRYKTKAEAIGNYKIFNKMGYIDFMTGEHIEGLTFELL